MHYRDFPAEDRDAARALVESYRGPDHERVQRMLVVLADGDLRALEGLTKVAHGDYRDVLYWESQLAAGPLRSDAARAKLHEWFAALGVELPHRPS